MRELYQLSDLKKEILEQRRRLARLEEQIDTVSGMSGIPSGGNPADRVGNIVTEKVALEQLIKQNIDEYWRVYQELEIYISNIPDSFTRRIFRLRFFDSLKWEKIAMIIGGNQTGDSVRKICKRFLEKH